MRWFKSLRAAFINNREVNPGDVFQYGGQPGKWLQSLSQDDLKKHRAAVDASAPAKPVEQRLDELELVIGSDTIARAVARKAADDAKRAAAEKAASDKAAKVVSDKAAADVVAQEKADDKAAAAADRAEARAGA